MRYALKFAYDGSMFQGYARQPEMHTIEGDIIDAMVQQGIIPKIQQGSVRTSSRTDKGVSAAGNVISIETEFPRDSLLNALNAKLEGIVFYGITEVDEEFSPRKARSRHYRYILSKDEVPEIEALKRAASIFVGEHDFRHFSKKDTGQEDTVLTIDYIDITDSGQFIYIDIKAHRFLWQLVRRIAAFMQAIASGEIDEQKVREMLEGSALVLASVKPMPPENLILMDVEYGFEFEVLPDALAPFEELRKKALVRAEVIAQIPEIV